MKALVIYDSVFGNTEKIAQAITKGLGAETQCLRAGAVTIAQLSAVDTIVMGSPTRSFAATPAMMSLLEAIPADALAGIKSGCLRYPPADDRHQGSAL